MPEHINATYTSRLRSILELEPARALDDSPTEYTLRLSSDAERIFDGFAERLEPQLSEFGDLAQIADWASKLTGAVARIMGLLHAAQHIRPGASFPLTIEAETVERAIEIGQYFTAHAKAAFAEMGADPVVEDAKHILRWFQRRDPIDQISRSNLFSGLRGRFKKVDDIDPAIRLLIDHLYLRPADMPARPVGEDGRKRRGQNPSPLFDVNPKLYTENSEITENSGTTTNSMNSPNSLYAISSLKSAAAG